MVIALEELESLDLPDPEDMDIDPTKADISMPDSFRERFLASARVGHVKDANLLRLNASANKLANPARAEEFERAYRASCWAVAYIDKVCPAAKAISKTLMAVTAKEESERQA